MPLSSGVALVCSSSSPVMAPTSSVITPPVVETKVERKGRLDSASPTSACPTRSKHLLERGFLGRICREVPVRLDPDPPPSVLAPVVVVRRFPGLRPLVPFAAGLESLPFVRRCHRKKSMHKLAVFCI